MNTTTPGPSTVRGLTLNGVAFAVAPLVAVGFAIATPFVVPDSPVAADEAVMYLPLTAMFGFAYSYGAMVVGGIPAAMLMRRLGRCFGPAYVLAGALIGAIAALVSGWGGQMVVWASAAGGATGLAFLALNVGMAPDDDPATPT